MRAPPPPLHTLQQTLQHVLRSPLQTLQRMLWVVWCLCATPQPCSCDGYYRVTGPTPQATERERSATTARMLKEKEGCSDTRQCCRLMLGLRVEVMTLVGGMKWEVKWE